MAKITKLPHCDFCNADAHCDGKTKQGSWANMCKSCSDQHWTGQGTFFELITIAPKQEGKVLGLESDDLEYWESIVMDSNLREITCPECSSVHEVEPDADYEYQCSGCGREVQCPVPLV